MKNDILEKIMKNGAFFMIFPNISFFHMVVNYWTGPLKHVEKLLKNVSTFQQFFNNFFYMLAHTLSKTSDAHAVDHLLINKYQMWRYYVDNGLCPYHNISKSGSFVKCQLRFILLQSNLDIMTPQF